MFEDVVAQLVELTDAELDARIRDLELQRRATEAELAAAVAVADSKALNEADGHRSMAAYLRATCNWAGGEVARFRGAARTVDAHPEIGDAWLEGHIGSSQVAELSRTRSHRAAGERFGEFVPAFVDHAEQLPFNDFRVVLQRFLNLADADGTHDEREAIERRSATVADVGGELHLTASGGDALAAAEIAEIMRRFEQAEFDTDLRARDAAIAAGQEPPAFRSGPQRRFDALVMIMRAAAAHDGDIVGSEPLVSVLVDQTTMSAILARAGLGATDSLTGETIDPFTGLPADADLLEDLLGEPDTLLDRRCETTTGTPLQITDVLRAALSGKLRRVVLGAKGRVVDLGRSSRVFTGAAREAAQLLTTTCEHPGCEMPADWCQVDHSTEWHEHGRTDQDNSGIDCAFHNRDKHRHRRRTRRALDGRAITIRADGTLMLPVGVRPPPLDDQLDDDDSSSDDEERQLAAIRARVDALRPAS